MNIILAVKCEKIIFECNFDNGNSSYACGGKITYTNLTNVHQFNGVLDSSNTLTTNLKYDVTDYSSICNYD